MLERRSNWVDQANQPSNRSTRRHAAREGQRAKRLRGILNHQQRVGDSKDDPNPKEGPVSQTPEIPEGNSRRPSRDDSGYDSESGSSTESEKTVALIASSPIAPSSLNALSSLRKNQLGNLPVLLNARGDYLLDHFISVMPLLLQNVKESASNKMVLNPLSLLGPISFRSIVLVAASMHVAKLHGLKDSVESLQHKSQVMHMIHSGLDGNSAVGGATNEMIAAVLGLAYDENQFGAEEMTLLHMKAAMRMVRMRGGQDALDEFPILSMFVNWVNTDMVSPLRFDDLPALSTVPLRHEPSSSGLPDPSTKDTDLRDFIDFLFNAEVLYLLHRHVHPDSNPIRRRVFGSDTTFHHLLTKNVAYKGWDDNRNFYVARNLQMHALILITTTLWNYRESATACDCFLKTLHMKAIEADLDVSLATGILIGIMWKIEFDGDEFAGEDCIRLNPLREKRIWYASRLLRVARVLSRPSFDNVHHALTSLLEMDEGAIDLVAGNNAGDWRMELRREILSQDAESKMDSSIEHPT